MESRRFGATRSILRPCLLHRTTECSRRVAEYSNETLTHSFRVCKTDGLCNRIEGFAAILDPRTRSLYSQALNRLGGRHSCSRGKRTTELPHAQARHFGQP